MTDKKTESLRQTRTLNPYPEAVTDALFDSNDFFDPRDLLQVRYEMVRCTENGVSIERAARRFGTSIPTCVRAKRALREGGLQALVPQRRGPQGAHKITPEIVDFLLRYRAQYGPVGSRRLAPVVAEVFGIDVHPRSLDKALAKKN